MKYIIDRFEGDIAVCECADSGETVNLHRSLFMYNAKEGDAVTEQDGKYILDNIESDKRRKTSKQRLAALFARSKKKGE